MWPLPGMTWKDDPKQGIQSKVRGNKGVSSCLNAPLMKTSRGCDVTLRSPHPAGQPRPLVDKLRNAAKQTSKSKMLQKKKTFFCEKHFLRDPLCVTIACCSVQTHSGLSQLQALRRYLHLCRLAFVPPQIRRFLFSIRHHFQTRLS